MARGIPAAVPSLTRWGVSVDADLVYRTLVLCGARTGGQAARELGITEARVRRALDELAALGAAGLLPGRGERRWAAGPADRVLAALRRPRPAGCAAAAPWKGYVRAVAGVDLGTAAHGSVQRLTGREPVRDRIAALMAAERHEHLAINTEEVISADAARAALPLDRSVRDRGIRMRVLGLPLVPGSDPGDLGGEYRETGSPPLKLLVFDRRAALFPVDPVDRDAGAVLVTDADVVDHFTRLFYRIWNAATDPRRPGGPSMMLTLREQSLVTLLAAGHSEGSAAAELGLSRRTVVYTLRNLMDRLHVENRFQLALVLGAARVVPLPGDE